MRHRNLEVKDIFGKIPVGKRVNVMGQLVDVPVKYSKLHAMIALFPINTQKAKDLLGCRDFQPIEIYPGKCLLNITSFDFVECPVGPYKEICLSIPVLYKPKFYLPLLPLLFKFCLKNFGFFAYLLTCDTPLSRAHSHDCFGYTVYRGSIDMQLEDLENELIATATEGNDLVYRIKAKKITPKKIERNDFRTFFVDEGKALEVELNVVAAIGRKTGIGVASLELGNHEISRDINKLGISNKAIEVWYYRDGVEILNVAEEIGKVDRR